MYHQQIQFQGWTCDTVSTYHHQLYWWMYWFSLSADLKSYTGFQTIQKLLQFGNNECSTTWRVWIIMQYDTCILPAQFVRVAGGARALNTAPRSFTFTSLVIQNVAGLHVSLVASVFWLYFCSFQEAYAFWICSTHLPMWLLDSDSDKYVEVEACRSTCLMVEKRCPFLIKGTEDDMASGNPSFMCKGKRGKILTNVGLLCTS